MKAAGMGHLAVVRALLCNGAEVNARDDVGYTALGLTLEFPFWADPGTGGDCDEVIRLLRQAGGVEYRAAADEPALLGGQTRLGLLLARAGPEGPVPQRPFRCLSL